MFRLKKYNFLEFSLLIYRIVPLWAVFLTAITMISSVFPSIAVVLTGKFLDAAMEMIDNEGGSSVAWFTIAIFAIFVLLQNVFNFFSAFMIQKASLILTEKIKHKMIFFKASVQYEHFENQEDALLLQKVTEEFERKINDSFECLMLILRIIINFLGMAVVFVLNGIWIMGSLMMVSTAVLSILSYENAIYQYKLQQENYCGEVELHHATYILKDRSTVNERNLYQYSKRINSEWREKQDALDECMLRANSKMLRFRTAAKLINLSIAFFLTLTVVYLASKQLISLGAVIALSANLISFVTGLCTNFISLVGQITALSEYIKDYKKIIEFAVSDVFLKKVYTSPKVINSIEFKNVSFKYPASTRYSLKNVSFRIESGKKYAFVGPNGSGKTTIVKLLMKFYTNYTGEILINNENLKKWSFFDIQSSFGTCFQDFSKYQLSFKDNIDIGAVNSIFDFKQKDYQRALAIKTMQLEKLVKRLPDGENTCLGKIDVNAQELSGGEWQRVALARLIMKKVNFYILDEPTASLDVRGECEIYKLFDKLSQNQMLILISHRLGSTKFVDKVFVMNEGKLVEEGTHEKLLKTSGLYAQMYKKQSEWYK